MKKYWVLIIALVLAVGVLLLVRSRKDGQGGGGITDGNIKVFFLDHNWEVVSLEMYNIYLLSSPDLIKSYEYTSLAIGTKGTW
jgi:hypothetical protein